MYKAAPALVTKKCRKCGVVKSGDEFRKRGEGKAYGKLLYSHCKECERKLNKQLRELHKTAPSKSDSCDCCGKIEKRLMLDHDHKTLDFRGWLCDNCNRGLSHLGDNIEGLQRAITYLKRITREKRSQSLISRIWQWGTYV